MTIAQLQAALAGAIAAADRNAVILLSQELKRLLAVQRNMAAFDARKASVEALVAQYG